MLWGFLYPCAACQVSNYLLTMPSITGANLETLPTLISLHAQGHYAMALTVASWSLVEIPRYLFYFFNLGGSSQVPDGLFWLRYSLFAILYPT